MKKSLSLIAYAVIVFVTISSCSKKKDDPTPANPNNTNPIGQFYFTGTFDHVAYNQSTTASTTAFNNGVGSSSVGNYVDYENSDAYVYEFWEGSYWTKISYVNGQFDQDDALVMRFHKSFDYAGEDAPTKQDIQNIFAVGNYTNFSAVSSDTDYPTTQGWDIVLTDSNGKVWSSYKGTASQTGSYIKIDSQKDVTLAGSTFLSAKGSLSCKLYDGNGNVKVLEGSFNHIFSDYSAD